MRAKLFIVLLLSILCFSCSTPRKLQSKTELKENVSIKEGGSVSTLVDTTKTGASEITIVEVTFSGDKAPTIKPAGEDPTPPLPDPDLPKKDTPKKTEPPNKITAGGVTIEGDILGAKITNIKTGYEEKGITASDSTYVKDEDRETESKITTKEEADKDPYRWRWIFAILLLITIVAAAIYFKTKKINVWSWIKKALHL